MSLLSDVQTQLAAQLTSFNTVGLSWTTQALENFDTEKPAALYYLDGETSEPSPFDNETIQPKDVTIAVLVVCDVANLETLLEELRDGMRGFQPSGVGWDVFEHVDGEIVAIIGGIAWWRDRFSATNYSGSI